MHLTNTADSKYCVKESAYERCLQARDHSVLAWLPSRPACALFVVFYLFLIHCRCWKISGSLRTNIQRLGVLVTGPFPSHVSSERWWETRTIPHRRSDAVQASVLVQGMGMVSQKYTPKALRKGQRRAQRHCGGMDLPQTNEYVQHFGLVPSERCITDSSPVSMCLVHSTCPLTSGNMTLPSRLCDSTSNVG